VEARHPVLLLGAPGTGRTTTVVSWAVRRVADNVTVVAPTRAAARRMSASIAGAVPVTLDGPVARTPQSLAWAVLREHAAREGAPSPRLVTGGESDLVVAELLAGHETAEWGGVRWPPGIPPAARLTRAFRADLRELWSRVVERGLGPTELDILAHRHDRPEWAVAAALLRERSAVAGLRGDNAWDPAEILDESVRVLRSDPPLREWARGWVGPVAVDDAHDLTAAGWRLLAALVEPDAEVLVTGDPDLATQSFRGGRPGLLVDGCRLLASGRSVARLVLPIAWRQGSRVAAVSGAVAERIGVVTAVHRRPRSAPHGEPGSVGTVVCADAADEAATVAAVLLARHHDPDVPVPWAEMAVVARSGVRLGELRRALRHADIPTVAPPARPLRDEPAVRLVLRAAVAAEDPARLSLQDLQDLTCGPLGGGDPAGWRRLLGALSTSSGGSAAWATAAEGPAVRDPADPPAGGDPGTILLAAVRAELARPAHLGDDTLPRVPWPDLSPALWSPVARVVRCLRVERMPRTASAVQCLWGVWSRSGLAEEWRRQALADGSTADVAGADLDAVVALFRAATDLAERLGPVTVAELATRVLSTAVRDDDVVDAVPQAAVTLTTPAGAAGREWDLVVVAGVQEGAWPDLRMRGSLLGTDELVDLLEGRDQGSTGPSRRADLLDDEARLFHVAVSRARRALVVTAVDGDDERPSRLFDIVRRQPGVTALDPVWHGHRVERVVALLRRRLLGVPLGSGQLPPLSAETAVRLLATMARAGVPGAHPDDWAWARPGTDPGPRCPDLDDVRLSPSQVERFHACPLGWYLSRVSGRGPDEPARVLGTLLHEAARDHATGPADELADAMLSRVEAEWDRLGLTTRWIDERERRRARRFVDKLAEWAGGRDGVDRIDTEVPVDAVVDGVRVRGSIDRLEHLADGSVRIVDLKTGAPVSRDAARDDLQLAVYQLAVQESDEAPAVREAILVHLGGPGEKAVERGQPALAGEAAVRARAAVRSAAEGMAGDRFPARPGVHCDRCHVRAACPAVPEGRRPGPRPS
jgi:superfamily I DNA/RNA helicase/RecB family exonuclease